jgi:ferric iron reductase protein FhuF
MDIDACLRYLKHITKKLKSPSLAVTASQFSKRYAFLAVLPTLYAMSVYNKGLAIQMENCHIESATINQNWLPKLRLSNWTVTEAGQARQRFREELIYTLFARNVAQVLRKLSQCTGISSAILWENIAIYVYWLYETMLKDVDKAIKEQVREDFHYLTGQAPSYLFAETFQPIAKFFAEKRKTSFSEQPIRLRQTCCLYYILDPEGACCTACPKKIQSSSLVLCSTEK